MKALVTGATGFVGSHLVRRLLERGNRVRILRRASATLDLLGEAAAAVEHVIGDVSDGEAALAATRGMEVVFHVAGMIGPVARQRPDALHRVNVLGTAVIVDASLEARVGRFVHTSSIAALGRPESGTALLDESTEWVESGLTTHYARSKHGAELEVHRGVAEGLDAVLVNPSLVFGEGRAGQNTMRLVESVRACRLPAVPVGGTNVVDVEDVVDGHLRALSVGVTGERYILGSENLSWRAIIDTIAAAFGVPAQQRTISPRAALWLGSVFDLAALIPGVKPLVTRENARQSSAKFAYDNTRARTELGCTFRPFAETVRRIAEAHSS